jgi:serpin B
MDGDGTADAAFGADLYRLLGADWAPEGRGADWAPEGRGADWAPEGRGAGQATRGRGADDGNLVFSPVSIAAALRMALCGARGDTAAELAAALHLDGPEAAAEGLRLLSAGLADVPSDQVVFRAPNTMWVQSGMPLVPEFTATLRDAAAVSVRDADFRGGAEQARQEINHLVAKQTEDKITGLLPPGALDTDSRLVLVNAIYLNAAWAFPFPEAATEDGPFYSAWPDSGNPVTARMMRLRHELRYLRGDGYQAVLLPYRSPRLAMTIVLPDGPIGSLPPGLAADLGGLAQRASRRQVTLVLPRFRQEAEFNLIPALRRLGVEEAFGGRADFSGITLAEHLYISVVAHKAYIDVAEWGTEAAAATGVVAMALAMTRPQPPVTMVVDHPFLFAITDTATGLPLFLGQVTRPREA